MTGLMVSHQLTFFIGKDLVLLLLTGKDNLNGLDEILLGYKLPSLLNSKQRCLVDDICQIRTYSSTGGQRQLMQIHGLIHFDILAVYTEDILTSLKIRPLHYYPAVKPSRTEKRLIQHLRPVGSRKDHDTLCGIKAIHFRKQLVQCLLTLGVTAHMTGITAPADGIDLIDEDDTGCLLVGLLEQIPHTGCTDTDIHFHEFRTGDGEEGNLRFTGHSLRQQCLTCTRRAYQKRTLRQLRTDLQITFRLMKEIHHLGQRFLGFLLTGHILKCDAGILLHVVDLGI